MTTNTSTAPLLQPPPQDITDKVLTRQWMENIYRYLYQQTLVGNTLAATTASLTSTISELTAPALVLLETQTSTSTASFAFPTIFTDNYTSYKIIISNLYAVTAAGNLALQYTTNGSTYLSPSSYKSSGFYQSSSTLTATTFTTTYHTLLANASLGLTSGTCGEFNLYDVRSAVGYPTFTGHAYDSDFPRHHVISGAFNVSGTALTGFQLYNVNLSGGLTGTVSVYGVIS